MTASLTAHAADDATKPAPSVVAPAAQIPDILPGLDGLADKVKACVRDTRKSQWALRKQIYQDKENAKTDPAKASADLQKFVSRALLYELAAVKPNGPIDRNDRALLERISGPIGDDADGQQKLKELKLLFAVYKRIDFAKPLRGLLERKDIADFMLEDKAPSNPKGLADKDVVQASQILRSKLIEKNLCGDKFPDGESLGGVLAQEAADTTKVDDGKHAPRAVN